MENIEQNNQENIHEFFKRLLFERDKRIQELEAQVMAQEPVDTDWRDRYVEYRDQVEAEKMQFQKKIESLQSQVNGLNGVLEKKKNETAPSTGEKSGNVLWTLAFLGLGTVLGFFVQKWFFSPKDSNAVAFQKLKNDHQFNFEFDLSNGRFGKVESKLTELQKDHEQLHNELEFTRKLLAAAHRKFDAEGFKAEDVGMSYPAPSDVPVVAEPTDRKTLTVTEDNLSVRAEASSKTERLTRLGKGEKAFIVDKTADKDKISYTVEGRRATIRDYWYKVETKEGVEGWIFGYFTSKSRNAVEFEEPLPEPVTTTNDSVKIKVLSTSQESR